MLSLDYSKICARESKTQTEQVLITSCSLQEKFDIHGIVANFCRQIYHVYRGGFRTYNRQISLQYFAAFKKL